MSFNNELVKKALAEREYFKRGTRKEYEDPWYKRVGEYWKTIGRNYDGRTRDANGERIAWSAAFISWLVKSTDSSVEFPPSESHSGYIRWAFQNRRDNVTSASFFAYSPSEIEPAVGDIVTWNRNGGSVTLGNMPEWFPSHGALVVEVDRKKHYIRTIGGNESDSVGSNTLELTPENRLLAPPGKPKHYIALIRNTVDPVSPQTSALALAAAAGGSAQPKPAAKKPAPVASPVAATGIDTIVRLDQKKVACVRNTQQFILKYLYPGSTNVNKNWTAQELMLCRAAGLLCGSIMQRRNNQVADFSRVIGEQQGRDAHDRAHSLSQPGGSAIYFGVDYDASLADFNKYIRPYFEGVAAAFDSKHSQYLVGAYGSALVLEELQKLKLVKFAWLPGSTGWGYGRYKTYLASNQWSLHQTPDTKLCGFDVDINRCRDLHSAGLFTPPGD